MMDPIKKIKLGPEAVMEKFGVTPDKVVDVQALAGDSTDNVPGVPGIGVKTAAQLINEYGDLETLLSRAGEIKQPKRRESLEQNAELIRISKQLVTLRDDVPAPAEPATFDKRKPDPNVLLPWLEKQGFKALIAKYAKEFGQRRPADGATCASVAPAPQLPEASRPAPAARAKSNSPSPRPTTRLIRTEAALDEWIAEATKAGVVAFDSRPTRSIRQCGLVGLSFALLEGPWGNVNSQPPSRGLPADRPSRAGRRGAGRARSRRRRHGRRRHAAARPARRSRPWSTKLKPLLEDPGVLKVGHEHQVRPARAASGTASQIAPVDDTMLLSFVLDGGKHSHGMDDLAERYLEPEDHQVLRRRRLAAPSR